MSGRSVVKIATNSDRANVCTPCNKSFSSRSTLTRHQKTVHGVHKLYDCTFCSQSYDRVDTWRRHIKTVHKRSVAVSSPSPVCSPMNNLYPQVQPGYNADYLKMLEQQAPTMSISSPVHELEEPYKHLPTIPSPSHSVAFSDMDCAEALEMDEYTSTEGASNAPFALSEQSPIYSPTVEAYSPTRPEITPAFLKPRQPAQKRKSTTVPLGYKAVPAPEVLRQTLEEPSKMWPQIVSAIHGVRFEAEDSQGKLQHHNDPALFFLGAPSSFAPTQQAQQLAAIRREAILTGEYLGVRHIPLNVMCIRKMETARLPDGTVYSMSSTWTMEPEPRTTHECASQTESLTTEVTHL